MVLCELPRTRLQYWLMRLASAVSGFPLENLHDLEAYRARLLALGYVDVRCEDISEDVFPGFGAFVEEHYQHFQPITAWSSVASLTPPAAMLRSPVVLTDSRPHAQADLEHLSRLWVDSAV
jgi:hypothetical protein